jgi:hypothetical protein
MHYAFSIKHRIKQWWGLYLDDNGRYCTSTCKCSIISNYEEDRYTKLDLWLAWIFSQVRYWVHINMLVTFIVVQFFIRLFYFLLHGFIENFFCSVLSSRLYNVNSPPNVRNWCCQNYGSNPITERYRNVYTVH